VTRPLLGYVYHPICAEKSAEWRKYMMKKELFPFFQRSTGKQVLVCGGGKLAYSRVKVLMEFNFTIRVVARDICPELEELEKQGVCSILRRSPLSADITDHNNDFVVIAMNNRGLNNHLAEMARLSNTPITIDNDAAHSDFLFPAIAVGEEFTLGMVSPGNHPEQMEDAISMLKTALQDYVDETVDQEQS
jgi:siroheme synthase-like protein